MARTNMFKANANFIGQYLVHTVLQGSQPVGSVCTAITATRMSFKIEIRVVVVDSSYRFHM